MIMKLNLLNSSPVRTSTLEPILLRLMEERDSIAIRLQKLRLSRALDYIRSPVKYAVARYFLDQEWISRTRYDEIMADRYNTKLTSIFDQTSQQQTTQDIFNDASDNDLDMEAVDKLSTGTSPPALH
ncbi:hypothetical protein G6F23_013915 [Rhizopus arrhizus]|nr:hypothetical protein G6F23_013915 [Rhizopus arrhizus]